MKRIIGYIAFMVTLGCLMGACSGVNQIIKSGDPEYAYQQALEFYKAEKWSKASTLFEACRHIYVGTPREDTITFYTAYCKFKERDWDSASLMLDEFRRKFGRSPFIEQAEGMYAHCFFRMAPGPKRDQALTTQAIVAISEFMSRYPSSEQIPEFQQMIDILSERLQEKSYLNAYTYYKIGRYKSAIVAFKNAIKRYPDSKHREDMMYYTVVSSYRLASNSVESKQTDRYLSMLDSYYTFLNEYPESDHLKELGRMAKDARNYLDKNRTADPHAEEQPTQPQQANDFR